MKTKHMIEGFIVILVLSILAAVNIHALAARATPKVEPDHGYVYQLSPECWQEPAACNSMSMYPPGF